MWRAIMIQCCHHVAKSITYATLTAKSHHLLLPFSTVMVSCYLVQVRTSWGKQQSRGDAEITTEQVWPASSPGRRTCMFQIIQSIRGITKNVYLHLFSCWFVKAETSKWRAWSRQWNMLRSTWVRSATCWAPTPGRRRSSETRPTCWWLSSLTSPAQRAQSSRSAWKTWQKI